MSDRIRAAFPSAPSWTARRAALRLFSDKEGGEEGSESAGGGEKEEGFEEREARRWSWIRVEIWPDCHLEILSQRTAVVLFRWRAPPRPKGANMTRQKMERRTTSSGPDVGVIVSKILARAENQESRAPSGMVLITEDGVRKMEVMVMSDQSTF